MGSERYDWNNLNTTEKIIGWLAAFTALCTSPVIFVFCMNILNSISDSNSILEAFSPFLAIIGVTLYVIIASRIGVHLGATFNKILVFIFELALLLIIFLLRHEIAQIVIDYFN